MTNVLLALTVLTLITALGCSDETVTRRTETTTIERGDSERTVILREPESGSTVHQRTGIYEDD